MHLETTHLNDMLNLNFHSWALSEYYIIKENRGKFFRKYINVMGPLMFICAKVTPRVPRHCENARVSSLTGG